MYQWKGSSGKGYIKGYVPEERVKIPVERVKCDVPVSKALNISWYREFPGIVLQPVVPLVSLSLSLHVWFHSQKCHQFRGKILFRLSKAQTIGLKYLSLSLKYRITCVV